MVTSQEEVQQKIQEKKKELKDLRQVLENLNVSGSQYSFMNDKWCIYKVPLSKALYTHIHTLIAAEAMQGINQHIGSRLGFNLPKDTSTCRQPDVFGR